ncbi:DUF4352 domain-containing protein [Streptomyces albipurpureus]|uniref:DUF4352 domain-containing protein n=1 Tax=Streptomyces albipurpureus TaxID=2897419 RepID=A0ABT0UMF3_9ACTN|nr:DUF4352 domain-containing protein [Streptomyces sp. CWNU-1]MCM2389199.1 DUF4352 domain-containing protein [Streptomyces sp. CWNU-1]
MRRHITSALLLTALVMGTATACRSVLDDGDGQSPHTGRTSAAERAVTDQRGRRAVSWVGDSVDIDGRAFGEHLRVSVLGFVDPAIATRAAAQRPTGGNRRLGVDVTLANVGGKPYDASRAKAWVVDDQGKSYPAAVATERITTGLPLKWNTLAAGEQSQGWLVFEVPESAVILRLHCTLGSTTMAWQLHFPPSR